jgi:hypothetical protein
MTPFPSYATSLTRARLAGARLAIVVGALAILAALALVACGAEDHQAAPAEEAAAAPVTGSAEAEDASGGPEVGTWETAPVTRAQLLGTLEEAGLGRYAGRMAATPGTLPERSVVLSLELRAGSSMLYASLDGQPPTVFDKQDYEVVGDTLELTSSVGRSVLRPTFDGETLSLAYVSTTEPPSGGVPVEGILRAYYTTVPFTRTES